MVNPNPISEVEVFKNVLFDVGDHPSFQGNSQLADPRPPLLNINSFLKIELEHY